MMARGYAFKQAAAASLPSSGASTPLDSSATATPSASGSSKPLLLATIDISAIPYLSVEDEQALIRYYLGTVARTCAGFGLPEVVEATCVSYVKRFYLWNTCMDYHPRKIMSVWNASCGSTRSGADDRGVRLSSHSPGRPVSS